MSALTRACPRMPRARAHPSRWQGNQRENAEKERGAGGVGWCWCGARRRGQVAWVVARGAGRGGSDAQALGKHRAAEEATDRKLVRMLAAGEKIYAHLPAGAPPAADSVDAPTYLDYRMPSDRRDEVRRLGACWDAIRSRYYVPAGVSSKNVHQPWPLALKCDARRMSCEIPD